MSLYVLLTEGNPDCGCGSEFNGVTDNLMVAEAWSSIGQERYHEEIRINELWNIDGRSRFSKRAEKILREHDTGHNRLEADDKT